MKSYSLRDQNNTGLVGNDASGSYNGQIQLTNDLGGTAASPTVISTHLSSALPVLQGGTGQTTLQAALDSLAGTQSSGKYLRSDGTHTTLSSLQAGDIPNLAESQITNLVSDLAAKATDSLVVHLAGTETITGAKTFNSGTLLDKGSQVFNVKAYSAKGDAKTVADGAITTGTPNLTSAAAGFTAADVGKVVVVMGAGAAGVPLSTTILTYVSATAVTLNANAGTTVSGATVEWSTDDTTSIRAAITAATPGGGWVLIPPGYTFAISNYLALPSNVWLIGVGEASVIKQIAGSNVDAIIRGTGQISHSGLKDLTIDYNHQNNPSCSQGMSFGSQSSYITVKNIHCKNAKGFAISFTGTPSARNDHITVQDNLITDILGTPNDMLLVVSDYGIVTNNRVIGSTANISIVLFESDHLYAAGNIVELGSSNLGQSGISALSLRYSTVIGNKVSGSGTGYGMRLITEHDNGSPVTSAYNLVTDNEFDNLNTCMSVDETNYDYVYGNKFRTALYAFEFPNTGHPGPSGLRIQRNNLTDITTVVNNGQSLSVAALGAIFCDNNGYASQGDSAILNATNVFTANQTINGNIPYLALKTTQSGVQEWRWVSAYNDAASITLLDVTGGNIQTLLISSSALTLKDNFNIVLNTVTGTKIGTSTNQKMAFYNSTPIIQPSGNALTALTNLGLISSPTLAESDITSLVSDLALKAPLASPTFTGTLSAATISATGPISTSDATGSFFGRSSALGDTTASFARSTGEGDPTVIGGTVALFQSNSTSSFSARIGIIAGSAGSSTLDFGNLNNQSAGSLSWNNSTGLFSLSGGNLSLTSHKITSLTDPSSAQDAATKNYVDNVAQGLSPKPSARVATTSSETFTIASGSVTQISGTTVDGISPAVNDRILVKDAPASTGAGSANSTQPGNGIYVVTSNTTNLSLSRATDMDDANDPPEGAFVFVEAGTANASSGFVVTTPSSNATFTYGSGNIAWTQFSGAGEITAGNGLSKSGNTLSINTAITVDLNSSQALTNKDLSGAGMTWPTFNQNTTGSAAKLTTARTIAGTSFDGSANISLANKFIVQGTADSGLSGPQFLGALGTGILKNTTSTGVLSIAVAGDFPTLNQNTTGSAATLTIARAIYGNNFDGSVALTQIIASTYGGTGNGFTKFSGPASSEKTFTLPNASATILTDNAAVTIAQGGTGATTAGAALSNLGGATDTLVMHLAGTESATGVKTFTANNPSIKLNAATPAVSFISTQSGTQEWRLASGYNTASSISLIDITNSNNQVLIVENSNSTLAIADAYNISLGTSTGTKIGTSTSQKLAFYNSTPIVRPSGDIATALSNLGLVSSPAYSDQAPMAPAASQTITTNYSAVVVRKYTIASGTNLTVSSGAIFRVL